MHTFPNKLYFDSRFRADKRDKHADCSFTLPGGSLTIPQNYCALIDAVHIPNVFESVVDTNNQIYWQEKDLTTTYNHISMLRTKQYSGTDLALELQLAMNAQTSISGAYTVTFDIGTGILTVRSGTLNVSFAFWGRDWLEDPTVVQLYWDPSGTPAIPTVLNDATEVLGCIREVPGFWHTERSFDDFIDINRVKVCYLCSGDIGNFQSVGPRGESDILRRIDMTSPFGNMCFDKLSSPFEKIDCGGQTLNTIRVQLRDSYGNLVDIRGRSYSFSLVFVDNSFL